MSAYSPPIPNPGNSPYNGTEYSVGIYTEVPVTGGIMTGNLTLPSINITKNTASTTTTTGTAVITGGLGVSGAINSTTAGIGAVSTTYPLTVGHTTQTLVANYGYLASSGATGGGTNTGAVNFSIYTSGRIACGGEIDVYSDKKIKENIHNITDEDAELFFNIQPKTYNKIGSHNTEFGYISQDIAKVIPDLVNIIKDIGQPAYIDEDGFISPENHVITVNYQKIICLLHKKIQLMDKEIKLLKS
jgi:hypothetical protein